MHKGNLKLLISRGLTMYWFPKLSHRRYVQENKNGGNNAWSTQTWLIVFFCFQVQLQHIIKVFLHFFFCHKVGIFRSKHVEKLSGYLGWATKILQEESLQWLSWIQTKVSITDKNQGAMVNHSESFKAQKSSNQYVNAMVFHWRALMQHS